MEPVHALEASSDDVAVADSSGRSPDPARPKRPGDHQGRLTRP